MNYYNKQKYSVKINNLLSRNLLRGYPIHITEWSNFFCWVIHTCRQVKNCDYFAQENIHINRWFMEIVWYQAWIRNLSGRSLPKNGNMFSPAFVLNRVLCGAFPEAGAALASSSTSPPVFISSGTYNIVQRNMQAWGEKISLPSTIPEPVALVQ